MVKLSKIFPDLIPKKKWKVRSSSDPKKIYNVFLFENGTLSCDCVAGVFNRECRHKKTIRKLFNIKENL